MRKDIEVHINTGDVVISAKNTVKVYPFEWTVNEKGMERYVYGEISVPWNIPESAIYTEGIYISIPYTPIYKEFYIRIKRVYLDGNAVFLKNKVDGSDWFLVQSGLYGSTKENIYASQLLLVSKDRFYIQLSGKYAYIYSGYETDFNTVEANHQNKNLLLKCIPSNSYRYPTTGVGLIRWVNSNINYTNLSYVLQKEFSEDGTPVKNARFDIDTQKLFLDLDTSNVDGNL